jgi:threonine dehydratase
MSLLAPDAVASAVPVVAAYPRLHDIEHTAQRLAGQILQTPVWHWQTGVVAKTLSPRTEVWLKLELFQRTGSFKLRGALNCVQRLDEAAKQRGVVAASAGNHAVSVAYAARVAGTHAKLAMPRQASPTRLAACREQGAQLVLTDTIHQAFALAQKLVADEGRSMVHPFDGPHTAEGTATIGLELMR